MIHWLDNCENHGDPADENWGRSYSSCSPMGVGN